MQALGRLVSHEVEEHFATLLKQGDVASISDPSEADETLENVVRPAAFNRGGESRSPTNSLDDIEAETSFEDLDAPDGDASRPVREFGLGPSSAAPSDDRMMSGPGRTGSGETGHSELSFVLEKIEAAGASMRLVEERAQRQAAWTRDFLAAAKVKLKDAQVLVHDAESRCLQIEKRAETAEVALALAEQRCRTTESRLEIAEKRLEAAEHRLEAALELARHSDMRCAEATARALDAERCVHDVLNTVAKEFPAAQFV